MYDACMLHSRVIVQVLKCVLEIATQEIYSPFLLRSFLADVCYIINKSNRVDFFTFVHFRCTGVSWPVQNFFQ